MARLPVYHAEGNVNISSPVGARVDTRDVQALGNLGNTMTDVAAQWIRIKNRVEELDGKTAAEDEIKGILDEAQGYKDYKNWNDLEKKKEDYSRRLDAVLPKIAGGFSWDHPEGRWQRENQNYVDSAKVFLDKAFRDKYERVTDDIVTKKHDSAYENYIKTGNTAYKDDYIATLNEIADIGYLSREQLKKEKEGTKKWVSDYYGFMIQENPEEAYTMINNAKDLEPEDKRKLAKVAINQIENQKYYDGLDKVVTEGTEENKLYNQLNNIGLGYDEIMNNTSISESGRKALLTLAGYEKTGFKQKLETDDLVAFQLDLDNQIRETVRTRSATGKSNLQNDKTIEDARKLQTKIFEGLNEGYINKEKAQRYLNNVIGATYERAKRIIDKKDITEEIGVNPYAEGLWRLGKRLKAQGVDNDQVSANVHNLFYEALEKELNNNGSNGSDWQELGEGKRRDILNKAIQFALVNVPNVQEAKNEFNRYLPPSYRKEAMDEYYNAYNSDMSVAEQKELTQQIIGAQQTKAKAQTNLTVSNATYEFNADDKAFMAERKYTADDIRYTAQLRGVSVEEVLRALRAKTKEQK